jgi:Domain of unknown function (DUF4193)
VSNEQRELDDLGGEETSEAGEDLDEAEEPEDVVELAEDDDEEDEVDAHAPAGDDDSEQASLEELLAQRGAKRGGDPSEDDGADIMSLSSESRASAAERLAIRVAPIKEREEFVCMSCHLVKPRVQLADEERGLCRDCV